MLAKLNHPNIVKYHDCYMDAVYINIVMEHCNAGGDMCFVCVCARRCCFLAAGASSSSARLGGRPDGRHLVRGGLTSEVVPPPGPASCRLGFPLTIVTIPDTRTGDLAGLIKRREGRLMPEEEVMSLFVQV